MCFSLTTDEKGARPGKTRRTVPGLRTFARLGCGWSGFGLGVLLLGAGAAPWGRAATFTVTNKLDSGSGSFRQAILDANANSGLDTILFNIPGTGTHTISPGSALPTIVDPVVIDATSQPGFAGSPLIELDGANAGGSSSGIRLITTNSVIRGLVINRFGESGVSIEGLGGNIIQGNIIGLDVTGTLSRPNAEEGISVSSSWDNVIGGTNAADGNVISASGDAGVYLLDGGSNVILGNFIGTTASGKTRMGNSNNGVVVYDSGANVIGGVAPGAGNVIAGNKGSGIYLLGSGSAGNLVQGNYLGTDATGSLALSNTVDGITVSWAPSNLIGGTASGAGNVISANSQAGILITGSTNNLVQGNTIGARTAAGQALGNGYAGLTIAGASSAIIGGTVAGAGNVISCNRQGGIFMTGSTGVVAQGNLVGTDPTGTVALSNGISGITIAGGSSNLIGGTVVGAGNVISGNLGDGIWLTGGATGNLIQGNYIGTDASGGTAVGNTVAGLLVESAGNTVGGSAGGARNVISGNGLDGVWLATAAAAGNFVAGNFIGTDVTGTSALGNGRAGVGISGAPGNMIGGAGNGAGNVISGNNAFGIYLMGSGAAGNVIQGNKLGTDVSGLNAMGNSLQGVYVNSAPTNTFGGLSPGAGNLISANLGGIWLTNNASWNVVQGNWIGTSGDGISGLGNIEFGVICEVGANHNLIGGTAPGAANRIAYSQTIPGVGNYAGVRVRNGAADNAVLGNSIFANAGLGIHLGANNLSLNVPCDANTSGMANEGQNYPVLTQAVSGPCGTGISGTLNSRPNSVFLLEFFADAAADPSNHGQGQVWLGDKTVVTGADCDTAFAAVLTNPVPAGYVVSATATDAANNTSEFSADIPVLPLPALTILSPSSSGQPGPGSNQMVLTWTNTAALALEQTSSLLWPAQWTASTNVPVLTSSNLWMVVVTHSPANQFYRLSFE